MWVSSGRLWCNILSKQVIHTSPHPPPHHLYVPPPPHSLCSSSVTRWLTVSSPWLIFSCCPWVSFLMAWRSFSNILIFRSSSPSRSSTLQVPCPRPGDTLGAGGLGAGEAGEAGRRLPGAAAAGGEEALPAVGAGALTVFPPGLPPLLLPVLLLLPLEPRDESVRFSAAGPISACKRGRRETQVKQVFKNIKDKKDVKRDNNRNAVKRRKLKTTSWEIFDESSRVLVSTGFSGDRLYRIE